MRKGRPQVSVLMPARNAAATLPACVRSIRRQTEKDWECVIVDDGSTDDTLALSRRAAASDDRFVVVPAPARGLVAALNEGLRHCRGRFVARMDADDVMHRERLGRQAAELRRHRSLAAVGCHVRYFPRRGLSHGLRTYEAWRQDRTHRLGAGLAYYALFTIVPLLALTAALADGGS